VLTETRTVVTVTREDRCVYKYAYRPGGTFCFDRMLSLWAGVQPANCLPTLVADILLLAGICRRYDAVAAISSKQWGDDMASRSDTGGMGAEPPAGSRGRVPGQGVRKGKAHVKLKENRILIIQ